MRQADADVNVPWSKNPVTSSSRSWDRAEPVLDWRRFANLDWEEERMELGLKMCRGQYPDISRSSMPSSYHFVHLVESEGSVGLRILH